MQKTILLIFSCAILFGQEQPVLTIGEEKFSKAQFEALLNGLPDRVKAQFSTEAGKKQFATQLSEVVALAQEARRLKIEQDPKVVAQMRIQTDQVLAQAVITRLSEATPATDDTLRKLYETNKAQYQQVAARHILIRFKDSPVPVRAGQTDISPEEALTKATAIRKRIEGGEDFAVLAKSESDDTGSGAGGGSLGTFGRGQMIKEFEEAAFSSKVGELSQPVKTKFGYHIIQVTEIKNKSFEEAKPLLQQRAGPERARQVVDEVKKKANIKLDESYFGK